MKQWPEHNGRFWETAPFFRILLPFTAGIVVYDNGWQPAPDKVLLPVLLLLFTLFILLAGIKKAGRLINLFSFLAASAFLFFAGIGISSCYDVRTDTAWFGHMAESKAAYAAVITAEPAPRERTWKIPVRIIADIDSGKARAATGDAIIYTFKGAPMRLHNGDTILLPDKWQPIHNSGNPCEFDYARYCARNNVYFTQFCDIDDICLYAAGRPEAISLTTKCHDWCMAQLALYIDDHTARGLVQAMLIGDEVNLDKELLQSYADTGIVHIIAISGGNVMILFYVISLLLWWLRHAKHKWIKYLIAFPLVWFYVLMAGAPPSAVRAAIMFSLLALGVLLQRGNNSLNQLFATAFLLLCAQPLWLFSVGFQLSFVAVLSLIIFYGPVYRLAAPKGKITSGLWATVSASIAAEVLVAPLVIYYFHTFPLLFIAANVAAYIFMFAVLVLSIAIIVASFIPLLAKGIGIVTTFLVTVFDGIVTWLQRLNPESFHYLRLTAIELAVVYIVIGGIALFLLLRYKPMLMTGMAALCLLLALCCRDEWVRLHQRRIVVYNSGKANHIELINGNRYTVLYTDTLAQEKNGYATKPAHIYWQAWQQAHDTAGPVWQAGDKTVLLLNHAVHIHRRFPVDYLVINYKAKTDPRKLRRIFSPATIIIGNSCNRRQQAKWKKLCAQLHIGLHIIGQDGAFVAE